MQVLETILQSLSELTQDGEQSQGLQEGQRYSLRPPQQRRLGKITGGGPSHQPGDCDERGPLMGEGTLSSEAAFSLEGRGASSEKGGTAHKKGGF